MHSRRGENSWQYGKLEKMTQIEWNLRILKWHLKSTWISTNQTAYKNHQRLHTAISHWRLILMGKRSRKLACMGRQLLSRSENCLSPHSNSRWEEFQYESPILSQHHEPKFKFKTSNFCRHPCLQLLNKLHTPTSHSQFIFPIPAQPRRPASLASPGHQQLVRPHKLGSPISAGLGHMDSTLASPTLAMLGPSDSHNIALPIWPSRPTKSRERPRLWLRVYILP